MAFADPARSHSEFHAVLASLGANRVLELTLQTIGQIVNHHIVVHSDPRDVQEAIAHDHVGIARAVVAGQPRKAGRLMETHILVLTEYFSRQLGGQMNDLIEWR